MAVTLTGNLQEHEFEGAEQAWETEQVAHRGSRDTAQGPLPAE